MSHTYRLTMGFPDGATYSFIEDNMDEDDIRPGVWEAPFPNTAEDSLVFGLIEMYGQSEGAKSAVLWEHGEPDRVVIEEVPFSQA